jgi:aryl-alcohol dehydrogenase-like predicted oxidoreductase
VRSVFLQGLFFIEPNKLDSHFDSIKNLSKEICQIAKDYSINIATFCLAFVYANKNVSSIVTGVDSLDNLKENINNFALLEKLDIPHCSFEKFAVNDENIILPFNWEK